LGSIPLLKPLPHSQGKDEELQVVPEPKVDEAAFVISYKMARALADNWRSRILMELSVQPLSPSQFVDLVGGDLSEISRCFRQLAEWDYIEIVETRTGGQRRGGVERIYRRIQPAYFDTSVWESLPRAYRDEFTGSALESYIERISEAIAAGTFDDEVDRHLSWDVVALDRIAWTELGSRLDEILSWVSDLGAESARRMAETGEEPIPATVGLAAFRSPPEVSGVLPPRKRGDPSYAPLVISHKMAKAVANKWRSRILMELRVRTMSPTQFAKEIGGGRRHISRCFSQLAEWDYIEVAETRSGGQRRGGEEKIYRLKRRAYFDAPTWETLPRFLRDECSSSSLHSYFAKVNEAIEAGTFDAEVDRHLSWDGPSLDRLAWNQLGAAADDVLDLLPHLEAEAAERMAASGEEQIPTTVGLAVFRSPRSSKIIADPHTGGGGPRTQSGKWHLFMDTNRLH
jgi:hypothetical protein